MRLTPAGKVIVVVILAGAAYFGYKKFTNSGLIGGPPGSGSAASGEQGELGRPLRVGIVYWPGYAGGIYANNGFKPNKDCIFWNRHKLQVEFVDIEDPDAANKAFAKGGPDGVDVVWSTVDYWANNGSSLAKGGVNAKAIMQVDWSQGGDAVVADGSIRRVEDLAGKKVALVQFTPSHWLLEYNVSNSSLSPDDQKRLMTSLVSCDSEEAARDAFVANRVPAAVVWEPFVSEAIKRRPGSHVLVSSATASNLIADIMVAQDSFIKEHPGVLKAFVDGWLEGATEANRNTSKTVQLLMDNEPPYKSAGEEATRDGLSKVRLADLTDNTRMFGLDGKTQAEFDRIYNQAGQAWQRRGYVSSLLPINQAKDDTFVRSVYQATPVTPPVAEVRPPDVKKIAKATPILTKRVSIQFDTGSAALDGNARTILDGQVLSLAKSFGNGYLKVEGNTDNVGSSAANVELSERRANAAVNYLVTKGVPRNQLLPHGNGPNKPLASNDSADGRARNRRTDVIVYSQ